MPIPGSETWRKKAWCRKSSDLRLLTPQVCIGSARVRAQWAGFATSFKALQRLKLPHERGAFVVLGQTSQYRCYDIDQEEDEEK